MKIHHIRNATMILEVEKQVILIDPMLSEKGSMPSLSYFRFKSKRNPIVSLPENTMELLDKVTHCLITHKHADHIDQKGVDFLLEKKIPVVCSRLDEKLFTKKGLDVRYLINYWEKTEFLGGTIMGIPARHGYGFIAKPMGNVMGFLLTLRNQPSIYLSSDTIFTDDVRKVLKEYSPDLSVIACGSAQLDIGKPLLMHMEDIVQFIKEAPGKVIANHLEAVNHCPTTRSELNKRLTEEKLIDKVFIPNDGDFVETN